MTIAFAGHALVPFGDKIKAQVIEQIRKHIVHTENITFYFGGYGDFDMICARVCNELKKEYDGIEVIYVCRSRKNQGNAEKRLVRFIHISAD